MIENYKVILFDLDDTLYDEKDYVYSGFKAVCNKFPVFKDSYSFLESNFNAKKKPFNELFSEKNIDNPELFYKVLKTYQTHNPSIRLKEETKEMLENLKLNEYKIGLITDGRVVGQKNKINSLGLEQIFDEIIITDELAGKNGNVDFFRKPNRIAFQIMKSRFNIDYTEMVYIGDNCKKDSVAPMQLGMDYFYFNNKEGLYYNE